MIDNAFHWTAMLEADTATCKIDQFTENYRISSEVTCISRHHHNQTCRYICWSKTWHFCGL